MCDGSAGFGFPPYDSLVTEDPDKKKLAYQLRHSKATFPTPIWVDIEQDLEDAIEAAMYKHGTAAEVLAKASQIIDSKIKANQDASAK